MKLPHFLTGLLALSLAIASAPSRGAEGQPISEAETALFLTDHLNGVTPPVTLRYKFHRSGSMEAAFDDNAEVRVAAGKEGKQVSGQFLTGNRKVELPAVDSAKGNPVVLYFLERDIKEMERLTGGKANYFRKRIRLALAEQAQVRPVTVSVDGRQVEGREIRISPYVDDPMKEKFERYTGKYYLFTVSDAVPGGIYRIESVIPDKKENATGPLIDDALTFAGTGQIAKRKK